jgi:hypothetical protein
MLSCCLALSAIHSPSVFCQTNTTQLLKAENSTCTTSSCVGLCGAPWSNLRVHDIDCGVFDRGPLASKRFCKLNGVPCDKTTKLQFGTASLHDESDMNYLCEDTTDSIDVVTLGWMAGFPVGLVG